MQDCFVKLLDRGVGPLGLVRVYGFDHLRGPDPQGIDFAVQLVAFVCAYQWHVQQSVIDCIEEILSLGGHPDLEGLGYAGLLEGLFSALVRLTQGFLYRLDFVAEEHGQVKLSVLRGGFNRCGVHGTSP